MWRRKSEREENRGEKKTIEREAGLSIVVVRHAAARFSSSRCGEREKIRRRKTLNGNQPTAHKELSVAGGGSGGGWKEKNLFDGRHGGLFAGEIRSKRWKIP